MQPPKPFYRVFFERSIYLRHSDSSGWSFCSVDIGFIRLACVINSFYLCLDCSFYKRTYAWMRALRSDFLSALDLLEHFCPFPHKTTICISEIDNSQRLFLVYDFSSI